MVNSTVVVVVVAALEAHQSSDGRCYCNCDHDGCTCSCDPTRNKKGMTRQPMVSCTVGGGSMDSHGDDGVGNDKRQGGRTQELRDASRNSPVVLLRLKRHRDG